MGRLHLQEAGAYLGGAERPGAQEASHPPPRRAALLAHPLLLRRHLPQGPHPRLVGVADPRHVRLRADADPPALGSPPRVRVRQLRHRHHRGISLLLPGALRQPGQRAHEPAVREVDAVPAVHLRRGGSRRFRPTGEGRRPHRTVHERGPRRRLRRAVEHVLQGELLRRARRAAGPAHAEGGRARRLVGHGRGRRLLPRDRDLVDEARREGAAVRAGT